LNKELLGVKEQYEQLNAEKEILNNQLEKRPVDLDEEQDKQILRENLAILTSQYAQLNEANRAWQEFHQTQLANFRTKVQNCIEIEDDFSFDQIAQEIVDQITKEREDFTEQYQVLKKTNNDLQSGNLS